MRRFRATLLLGLALSVCLTADASPTPYSSPLGPIGPAFKGVQAPAETLVSTSPTPVPAVAFAGRLSLTIQNLGPNSIYCGSATVAVGTGLAIATNAMLTLPVGDNLPIYCICTVLQVSGAGTRTLEIK